MDAEMLRETRRVNGRRGREKVEVGGRSVEIATQMLREKPGQ